jgi:hypothetical protein
LFYGLSAGASAAHQTFIAHQTHKNHATKQDNEHTTYSQFAAVIDIYTGDFPNSP